MDNTQAPVINYIFYLQMNPKLDKNFYLLAEVLSKINITLIPIESHELKNLDKTKKNHIISIRNNFVNAQYFFETKKSFLDGAMAQNKVMVYDVSSFSEIENAVKFENKNVYRYFQLPLNLKQIAMTVAVEFFKERNSPIVWPGGRRAKLPSMINSN